MILKAFSNSTVSVFCDILPTTQEKWRVLSSTVCLWNIHRPLKDYLTIITNSSFFLFFFFPMKEHIQLCIEQGLMEGVFVSGLPDTSYRCLVRGKGPKANPAALSQRLCLSLRPEPRFVSFLWHPTHPGRTREEYSEHNAYFTFHWNNVLSGVFVSWLLHLL